MSILPAVKQALKRSPVRPLLQRRRLHAYCLGAPKTGTTSVAMMFRSNFRSEHEPLSAGTVELLRAAIEGTGEPDWNRALRRRDRELYLDMESSHPMSLLAGRLASTFPDARFILVYREPRSWLNSIINMRIDRAVRRFDPLPPLTAGTIFRHLNEWYYRSRYPTHPPEEHALKSLGLFTLDGYLSGWALHNRLVLEHVPSDRLLVLQVSDLTQHPERLARFLGISPAALDLNASHVHRATRDHGIVAQLDPVLLQTKIEQHCSQLQAELQRIRDEWMARLDAGAGEVAG